MNDKVLAKLKKTIYSVFKRTVLALSGCGLRAIPGVNQIYDFLFCNLWPNENLVEIQGSKMYVNVHDESDSMRKTFQDYALNLVHEEVTTEIFKNVICKGDVFLDIGANVGYFSLLASRLVGDTGRVFSFEPEPINYKTLIKNIELNHYANIYPNNMAVSNRKGRVRLFIHPVDTGHHTIKQYEGIADNNRKSVDVETISVDEFINGKSNRVDVVKIDAEGAELMIIEGMENTIKNNKNLKMLIEFYPMTLRNMGSAPEELLKLLLAEFRVYVVGGEYDSKNKKSLRIISVEDAMSLCKSEDSHFNLFVEKGNLVFESLRLSVSRL